MSQKLPEPPVTAPLLEHPRLTRVAGVCGGVVCIGGTRVPVWGLQQCRLLNQNLDDVLEAYPFLTVEDVQAAWDYADAHFAEIEAQIQENTDIERMARILADEHFDARIQDRLRLLGHDVISVRSLDKSKSGDGKSDEEVLRHAKVLNRIVITWNRKDFKALHDNRVVALHRGIITCMNTRETPAVQAARIDNAIKERLRISQHFDQQLIHIDASGNVVPQ